MGDNLADDIIELTCGHGGHVMRRTGCTICGAPYGGGCVASSVNMDPRLFARFPHDFLALYLVEYLRAKGTPCP